jgi:hypothetical protein
MVLGSRVRPTRKVDNLTATCESLPRQCGVPNISQPFGPPLIVRGHLYSLYFFTLYIVLEENIFNYSRSYEISTYIFEHCL